jgi:hypothetical protein
MDNFRQAEKEYLDSLGPKKPEEKQVYTGVPDKHFCLEGRKHQFINISGERTCNNCELITEPVPPVSDYGCWDTAKMKAQSKINSISDRFESFCTRRKITYSVLPTYERRLIVRSIQEVYDAEKPKKKTLPNLNILTYQICKRLNIAMDEKLLKIPVSRVPHDRCKEIFQTLGWKYIE